MKRRIIVVLALALGGGAFGQNSVTANNKTGFQWDWRAAKGLDDGERIGNSKHLSLAERNALTGAIAARLRPSMSENEITSERQLYRVAARTRIAVRDLNGDGIPEILAQAGDWHACGATGNCLFWVLQKTEKGYRPLLDTHGGIEVMTIGLSRTNGFFDIAVGTSESGTGRDVFLYRYSDGRYRLRSCYNVDWWSWHDGLPAPKEGTIHKLKKPAVTQVACIPDY